MQDLSEEIVALRDDGGVPAAAAARPVALESGRLFPLRLQILVLVYAGIASLLAGVGLLVRARLDDIGPLALLTAILLAAAGCYVFALRGPRGAGARPSLGRQYALLLGALLLSAAVGFAEVEFRLLGGNWPRHLLLLALVHGATAHAARSPLVLAVSLTAFAGWLGIETGPAGGWERELERAGTAWRCLACAAVFLAARLLHGKLARIDTLAPVYEHYAANLAFWGALGLGFGAPTRWIGAALLVALAVAVGRYGLRSRRESFVLYAIGYATFGLVALETELIGFGSLASAVGLATVAAAVVLMMRLRQQLKAARA